MKESQSAWGYKFDKRNAPAYNPEKETFVIPFDLGNRGKKNKDTWC